MREIRTGGGGGGRKGGDRKDKSRDTKEGGWEGRGELKREGGRREVP